MISKISYFKMVRQCARQRGWFGACMALVFFVCLPVAAMLMFSGDIPTEAAAQVTDTAAVLNEKREELRAFLAGGSLLTALAVGGSALLAAWSGLSYLHSPRKLDMLYSLPVKKEHIFWAETGASVLLFIIPYGINLLLANVVGAVRGIYQADMAGVSLAGLLVHLLFFLAIYFFGAAAMALTGKILAGILGSLVLLGFFPGTVVLLMQLPALFYNTWCGFSAGMERLTGVIRYLSPAYGLGALCMRMDTGGLEKDFWIRAFQDSWWEPVLLAGAAGVIMGILAWQLIRIRPSEGAGRALVFTRTEGAFKLLLLPVLGLTGGLFFRDLGSVYGTRENGWFWFGILFALLVGSVLIEVIYHADRKRIWDHKICTGTGMLVTVILGAWFTLDLGGFDTFLPDISRIQSMAVSYSSWDGMMKTEEGEIMIAQEYLKTYGQTEDFDAIYQLAEAGVETVKNGVSDTDADMDYVTVFYRMKNGQIRQRQYRISVDQLAEAEELLYAQEPYRNAVWPVLSTPVQDVGIGEVWDAGNTINLEGMSEKERIQMVETYRKELASMTYQELQEPVLARIRFYTIPDGWQIGGSFPINEKFTETLKLLRERGFVPDPSMETIRITSIAVECYREEALENTVDNTIYYADTQEKIQEVRQNMVWDEEAQIMALRDQYEPDIYAYVEGINEQGESVSIACRYPVGKIPQAVKDIFGLS